MAFMWGNYSTAYPTAKAHGRTPMETSTSGNGRTASVIAAPSHLAKANGRETSTSGNSRTKNGGTALYMTVKGTSLILGQRACLSR